METAVPCLGAVCIHTAMLGARPGSVQSVFPGWALCPYGRVISANDPAAHRAAPEVTPAVCVPHRGAPQSPRDAQDLSGRFAGSRSLPEAVMGTAAQLWVSGGAVWSRGLGFPLGMP